MLTRSFPTAMLLIIASTLQSCAIFSPQNLQPIKENSLRVSLEPQQGSAFKRVTATFTTTRSKGVVFRVVSDLAKTAQWLPEVSSMTPLKIYNNNHFLLRTVLNSPWPYRSRELITCVHTTFKPERIIIDIKSCSNDYVIDDQYVRVKQLSSRWTITQVNSKEVEIQYQAWLDPQGYVPAFFFNNELKNSSTRSFQLLRKIIEETDLSD